MPTPQSFQRAKLEIEGMRADRGLLQPDRVLDLEVQRVEVRQGHRARRFRQPQFTGGNPREISLSLLLDVSLLADQEGPRRHRQAVPGRWRSPAGRPAAAPSAAPPFIKFNWGTVVHVQGRLHAADGRLQALRPERRADPRRREDVAQAGRDREHGVLQRRQPARQPDHPRAGRPRRAPRQGRRHAALDRLPDLRRRRRSGARSPRPTRSRTRCTCAAAARSACPSWRLMPLAVAPSTSPASRSSSTGPRSTRSSVTPCWRCASATACRCPPRR